MCQVIIGYCTNDAYSTVGHMQILVEGWECQVSEITITLERCDVRVEDRVLHLSVAKQKAKV